MQIVTASPIFEPALGRSRAESQGSRGRRRVKERGRNHRGAARVGMSLSGWAYSTVLGSVIRVVELCWENLDDSESPGEYHLAPVLEVQVFFSSLRG